MAIVKTLVGGIDFKPKFKDMTTLEILKELYGINPKICKECGGTNIKNITLMTMPKLE